MKQSNTSKYSYLAGIIDCDGWIIIVERNRHKHTKPTFNVQVGLKQKDGRIVDWLYGNFGGNVYVDKRRLFTWLLPHSKNIYILKRILPFLKYKKKQAEIAIRLQTHIDKGYTGKRRNTLLSNKEFEIRKQLYQQIKEEKKNIIPCAVVENKRDNPSEMKESDVPNLKE